MTATDRRSFDTTPESLAFGRAIRLRFDGRSQTAFGADVAAAEGRDIPYSQSQVSDWLNGKEPNPRQAMAIEQALGCRPGTLTRLLGYMPLDAKPIRSFEDVIQSDPALGDTQQEALRQLYRALTPKPSARPRKSRP